MAFTRRFYALTCRSLNRPPSRLNPFSNPMLLPGVAAAAALQLAVMFVPFARPPFRVDLSLSGGTRLLLAGLAVLPALLIEGWRSVTYRRNP